MAERTKPEEDDDGGDVSAPENIADHTVVRGSDGAKGVQGTGITVSDTNDVVLPATSSFTCPEKIVIPLNEPTSLVNGCIWIA